MSARATINIEPDVADVLDRCSITGNNVHLPGQLDRKLYERVNKILVALGGKWNRSAAAHVFASDPRAVFNEAMGKGEVVHKKNLTQAFYTPDDVVRQMIAMIGLRDGMHILEPSAGHGAIVDAILGEPYNDLEITLVELDPDSVAVLQKRYVVAFAGDFLEYRTKERFDAVVMNPPFTKGQDIDHVMAAWTFLKPSGRLVSIMSGSVLDGKTKRRQQFRDLLTKSESYSFTVLPPGTFKESGTMVSTLLIGITK